MATLVARGSLALDESPTVEKTSVPHEKKFRSRVSHVRNKRNGESEVNPNVDERDDDTTTRPTEIEPQSSLVSNTSSKLMSKFSMSRSFTSVGSKCSTKGTDDDTVATTDSLSADGGSISTFAPVTARDSTIATCLVAIKDIVIEQENAVEVDIRDITCDIKVREENAIECVLNPTESFVSLASSKMMGLDYAISGESTSFESRPTFSRESTTYSTDYDASGEEDSVDAKALVWRPGSGRVVSRSEVNEERRWR